MNQLHRYSRVLSTFLLFIVTLVILLFGQGGVRAFADDTPSTDTAECGGLTQVDCESLYGTWTDWVPSDGTEFGAACGAIPVGSTTTVSASAAQAANAQIIIGIAKTENLGQAGALIGLMVGLDESGLKVDANENIPLSESNPNKQGDGSDHYSLGVFQQQLTEGWSTISNDINNQAAINQLMTSAYDAEAFFGSPPGSNAPHALSKGLQNLSGWQSLEPWIAAQKVQISGDPTGANYHAELSRAQSLLSQYYDSSPAVPLPVALSGGSGTSTGGASVGGCIDSGGVVQGNIIATAVGLAWDDTPNPKPSPWDSSHDTATYHGFQQLGVGDPKTYTKPSYQAAVAQYEKGVDTTSFTDCGAFVATVMRSSGVDPNYPTLGTSTQEQYVKEHPEKYTIITSWQPNQAQPGDIMIADGHTYIYVGKQGDGWSVAEASQGNHSPEIDNNPYSSQTIDGSTENFIIARVKQ